MKKLIWIGAFVFLTLAGSLLHVPQWVARAAGIYSSPMSNVLEAYRQPYQTTASPNPCTNGFCVVGIPAPAAGHRLVVQHLFFNASCPNAASIFVVLFGTQVGHANGFSTTPVGGFTNAGADVLMYFDPTDSPTVELGVAGAGAQLTGAQVTVTGYVENCAAYPNGICPPIQQ